MKKILNFLFHGLVPEKKKSEVFHEFKDLFTTKNWFEFSVAPSSPISHYC